MNTAIFLTTRYDSTRLPGKALLQVNGQTATDILIGRLKHCSLPIVMCTPDTINDEIYMKPIARKHGIGYFAGDKNNIIKRHYDAAKENNIDYIINVDGDDILACPDLIMNIVKEIKSDSDCIYLKGYPLGMNILSYTSKRLKKVDYNKDTNWGAKILDVRGYDEISGYLFNDCRLTLDWDFDFIVIKHVINELGMFTTSKEICMYMKEHPEICAINNHLNEQYYKRLEELSK